MAAYLPDGSVLTIATAYGASKPVTAVSNADPALATAAAHGVSNGGFFELNSGWFRANERIFRASDVTTDSLKIEGLNATSTVNYPAGTGAGSLRPITAWTQITQVLEFTTSGGEQQYSNFSFLEEDFERQLPTVTSAQSLTLGIADDPTLAGYQALKAASENRSLVALKLQLRNGAVIVYNGIVSLNETPSLNKGSVMQVTASIALQGRPTRY